VETGEETSRKEFLDNILASMDEGVLTIDQDARIITFNRAAERITGYKREEVLHKKCYHVLKSSLCKDKCAGKRTLETGSSMFNYEATLRDKAGKRIYVDITTSPLRSSDNKIIGLLEIITDLTEHKRLWEKLREERDKAQQYLSVARVIIVALNCEGEGAARSSGTKKKKLSGITGLISASRPRPGIKSEKSS
jgi:PAS domain S-box-containing protein